MSDLVVTVPKDFWLGWLAEGDLPDEPPGGVFGPDGEYDFTCGRGKTSPPPIQRGERVYVVAHGRLRGYAPLVRLSSVQGKWSLVRRGGAVAVTIDEEIRGFQGYRGRWWPREIERPFPDWRTKGIDVRCAAKEHRARPAVVWWGGLDKGQLVAFGSCLSCAARVPERAAAQGIVIGKDLRILVDLRPQLEQERGLLPGELVDLEP